MSKRFERAVSVDEVRSWKPAPQIYLHAAALCRVRPGAMALVAVHARDVHGARTAGLATGWASRLEGRWPASMPVLKMGTVVGPEPPFGCPKRKWKRKQRRTSPASC